MTQRPGGRWWRGEREPSPTVVAGIAVAMLAIGIGLAYAITWDLLHH